jgi:hypothetical protein
MRRYRYFYRLSNAARFADRVGGTIRPCRSRWATAVVVY